MAVERGVAVPRLELRQITKRYTGVVALDDVSISVEVGEVHALLGENGAGKSTLLKILSGVVAPTAGSVVVDGEPVASHSMGAARRAGIAMIHQELQQVPELTVAQNMFLGRPIVRGGTLLARGVMRERAAATLSRLDATIDPDQPIGQLRVAKRQLVEIARALLFDATIIAMDEPTSSLMPAEFERLVEVIDQLRRGGVSIIYVSHKLDEVRRICDRGSVLRDGRRIGTIDVSTSTEATIVSMMVGRDVLVEQQPSNATGEVLLETRGLSWQDRVVDVSFSLRRGEILGVAGLMGAGRTELMHVLAGLERPRAGEILVSGKPVRFHSVRGAIRAGIGLLPEERKREGIVPLRSALANAALTSLPAFGRRGWIEGRRLRARVTTILKSLQLRPFDLDRPIRLFSGGNQQKIIIARWLLAGVEILLLDEPTRGVDVGAKQEIYRVIRALAAEGKAVIVVSSELPEILQISDRVLVMRNGRVTAELERSELSEDSIMQYAARNRALEGVA
jgi:ribose transport system ATP-binding protein